MPKEQYIKRNESLIRNLERKPYFSAALGAYNQCFGEIAHNLQQRGLDVEAAELQASKEILSHLHDIMRAAEPLVEQVIQARKNAGEINDVNQARKSAAGNIFQQMLAYSLAKNVLNRNITGHVIVTTSVSEILDKYAAIEVDDGTLKPDSDVIVYSAEDEASPIVNLSCKTSCRERAGQTFKWKLLCDLVTCDCKHKSNTPECPVTKYHLAYTPTRKIKTCFVTADFYDELSKPQINSVFGFFDYAYVAKQKASAGGIASLRSVIDDLNSIFE